jgi:DNA polymerase III alpha subunit
MNTNKFGEIVHNQDDICDLIMQGHDVCAMHNLTVDPALDIQYLAGLIEDSSAMRTWALPNNSSISVPEFDHALQERWHMPKEYQVMDIAEHVLSLCQTQQELQRVAQELLLFQERDLFNLLRYLKYLVDVMNHNHVIWGVGRGSSVASYVLYLLGVHRINSMYYDLDVGEFLR